MFSALVAPGVALLVARLVAGDSPIPDLVLAAVSFFVYAAIGGLIIARRDGHPTGWLLLLIGLTMVVADGFAFIPGVPPMVVNWVANWGWAAVFASFAALTLTFPSGHLPDGSGRWARLGRGAVWALPVLVLITATTETVESSETAPATVNPIGFLPDWMGYPALFAIVAILLAGAVSLVVKRRGASGAEKAQLSWVVFALILLITSVISTFIYVFTSIAIGAGDPGDSAWIVAYLAMVLFPLSFGVAVLRYRLYEIDRIVSRTVSYTLVAGVLAVVFFSVVTLLTSLLEAESDLAVAGSTLAVAAVFTPLRRRVQVAVDRRFNRSRYDAQRVADEFSETLRDQVDSAELVDGWVGVVSNTMQPSVVGVWVR